MNGNKALVQHFAQLLSNSTLEHAGVFCLPFTLLDFATHTLPPSIAIGAQDCAAQISGAYTGDVSISHLIECGVRYVIVGHSERRQNHHESNELILKKAQTILEQGLIPIICVGETQEAYENGETFAILEEQLALLLKLPATSFLIAYEPVWAIGSGRVPLVEEVQATHDFIYERIHQYPLYGGSVKADNYKSFLDLDEVRGLLVGGESLKPERFLALLQDQ